MSTTQYKWNDENRRAFYLDLLEKYGEWKYWATKLNPFSQKNEKTKWNSFNEYLEEAYPNKKPLAQLSWLGNMSSLGLVADPNSDLPLEDKPMVTQKFNHRNWWQNKCSAYYAGFVGDEVFPDTFDANYPITKKEAWGQDRVEGDGITGLNNMFDDIPPDIEGDDDDDYNEVESASWGFVI